MTEEFDIRIGHALERLREIPDESVNLVVTSPPYWGLRDYKTEPIEFADGWVGQLGLEQTPDHFVDHLVEIFDECRRILKPNGNLWVNLGDSYMRRGIDHKEEHYGLQKHRDEASKFRPRTIPAGYKRKDLVGLPWMFAFAARKSGWYLRNDIVWAKSISGPHYRGGVVMPEPVKDRCTRSHEYFFHFAKSEKYYYDVQAYAEEMCGPDMFSEGEATHRNMRTVWHFNPKPFAGAHFAVYPKHLIEPIIKACSTPGDVVLDPFSGSGTTGIVATSLDRTYIGIELNPEFAALSLDRYKQERTGLTSSKHREAAVELKEYW